MRWPPPCRCRSPQRYQRATGDQLSRLLTDLTTAFNAGTITDSEQCVTQPIVTISTAQAARRIAALGVPAGSATPLAPLGAVALPVSAEVKEGTSLTFATLSGVGNGMLVTGPGIAPDTTVQSLSGTTVTLTAPVLDDVPAGSVITFTPAYSADLQALVKSWLAYPQSATSALPSSGTYQPADDANNFWPGAATANPAAFLNLVLAAVTQGYVIPAPFDVALGTQITAFLAALPGAPSPPTVSTLASVTAEQWTGFFQQNPTWLPPFTQPGNTAARIAAFISCRAEPVPRRHVGSAQCDRARHHGADDLRDDAAVRIDDRDRAGHDRHRAGHSARHDRAGGDVHQRDADRAGRGGRRAQQANITFTPGSVRSR